MEEKESMKCDVCGTEILEKKFSKKTEYKGKEYQFCGDDCKKEFEKNQKKFSVSPYFS